MNKFKDKNFIITGATSGIGLALLNTLKSTGANISFCGRSPKKLEMAISTLPKNQARFYHQAFDICDQKAIVNFISESIDQIGEIDFLVNCAGANSARAPVNEIEISDLESMIKVNLLAPFTFMKEVYNRSMMPKQSGMIINLMSTVCLFSNQGIGAYTASKSGFDALAKVFRKEARTKGVKVCSIYPGGVDTPFREAERPEYLDAMDVVNAILTLASQAENATIDDLIIRPMVENNYC